MGGGRIDAVIVPLLECYMKTNCMVVLFSL